MVSNIGNGPPGAPVPKSPEDSFRPGQNPAMPPVNSYDQQDFEKMMDGEASTTAICPPGPESPSVTQEDIGKFQTNMFVDALMNNRIEVEKEQW